MWQLFDGRSKRRSPSLPEGLRIYVIGDVHGRADLLDQVFWRIDADLVRRPDAKALHILLGDYVDRGRSSREVIERLIERSSSQEVICLRGNHEDCMLGFLRDPSTLSNWRQLGGDPNVLWA